jgi:hypothetical protein
MEIKNIKADKFIRDNLSKIQRASDIASFLFRSFGWTWGELQPSIPNYGEIYKQYLELIRLCIKANTHMVSTGRLVIEISLSKKRGDIPELSLYFDLS